MEQTSLKSLSIKICGKKKWENVIFQYQFQSNLSIFELWLLPNYCELFNYPWLTYVKLIIGPRDQVLLTGTRCGVYKWPYFNFACATSIVKSLKKQTFRKLINFESTYTQTAKHASNHTNMGVCWKRWLVHFQQEVWKTT